LVSQPPANGDHGVVVDGPRGWSGGGVGSLVVHRRQVAWSGGPEPEGERHRESDPATWRWCRSRGCRKTTSSGRRPGWWYLRARNCRPHDRPCGEGGAGNAGRCEARPAGARLRSGAGAPRGPRRRWRAELGKGGAAGGRRRLEGGCGRLAGKQGVGEGAGGDQGEG
jgi:hypothetical protein